MNRAGIYMAARNKLLFERLRTLTRTEIKAMIENDFNAAKTKRRILHHMIFQYEVLLLGLKHYASNLLDGKRHFNRRVNLFEKALSDLKKLAIKSENSTASDANAEMIPEGMTFESGGKRFQILRVRK